MKKNELAANPLTGPCESPRERAARVWGDWASAARPRGAAKSALALLVIGCSAVIGCGDDSSCPEGFVCTPEGGGGSGGGGGAQGGGGIGGNAGGGGNAAGGQGGDGGQGGGPNPICTPMEGEAIGAQCGVFVNAASVGGDGSQAMPYSSITQAVANLGSATHIYVCGNGNYVGSLALPSGVAMTGSLDCAQWSYSASNPKPAIVSDPNLIALSLVGPGDNQLVSLRVEGANASAPGVSSIALLVSERTLVAD